MRYVPDPADLFQAELAVKALDAACWREAMNLTDIYNCMPQARRDDWDESIRAQKTPEFTEGNVRETIGALLEARQQFLAERVDGLFRNLSGTHVTNSPTGFNRRMILSYVFSEWGGVESSRAGSVNDLRCVMARFMGRDEPRWNTTHEDLRTCRQEPGQWHALDGGALRVRVYKKGTAHLEIHPDMAWRLNAILHTLYPRAIPASQRTKPPKSCKTFAMIARPLPFAVLTNIRQASLKGRVLSWGYGEFCKTARAEAIRVLAAIGGVPQGKDVVHFDFDPADAISTILLSGCIPDQRSHQFYPTPESVARVAIEMAKIGPADRCLEPSAGCGGLADLMPRNRTMCVEISALHAEVLKSKGHAVEQMDFIQYAKRSGRQFDRIVMNPPFSEGRALAHTDAAFRLLAEGGRLVAVLPASMRGKQLVDGATHEWSPEFKNEFAGTSTAVAIVAMEAA